VQMMFWWLCLAVVVVVHSVVFGVHPVVVGLLASCVGVDPRSWVLAQLALCFISCSILVGLYWGSSQALFFLNTKCTRHDLKKLMLSYRLC
jgi:hypothetical protein